TLYSIKNPREGRAGGFGPPRPALLVDYEVVRHGKLKGPLNLVLHSGSGERVSVMLTTVGNRERGTIEVVMGGISFGPRAACFPKNRELYLTSSDSRYWKNPFAMKVSNSVVMGDMAVSTKARDWTQQEIDEYQAGPPPPRPAPAVPPPLPK